MDLYRAIVYGMAGVRHIQGLVQIMRPPRVKEMTDDIGDKRPFLFLAKGLAHALEDDFDLGLTGRPVVFDNPAAASDPKTRTEL